MISKDIVGQKIKQARVEKGLSQTELGQALNPQRSHAAISDIERGVTDVSVTDLSQIASALDKPLAFFVEGMPTTSMSNYRYDKDSSQEDINQGKQSVDDFDKFIDNLIEKNEL